MSEPKYAGLSVAGVGYVVEHVPTRKAVALVRNEVLPGSGHTGTPVAYFRTDEQAEQFRAWLVALLPDEKA